MKERNLLRAGFTLVEILVVIVIASIVLSILISVLGSSFEILRKGETRSQLLSDVRIALDYLTDDLRSAAYIPLSVDRDLNGYPDDLLELEQGGNLVQVGYGLDATWRVAHEQADGDIVLSSNYWMSEAWGDRLMTVHNNDAISAQRGLEQQSFTLPRSLRTLGNTEVVEYISLFRTAVPAGNHMPYSLASEWDRNLDGVLSGVELLNSGTGSPNVIGDGNGELFGYPEWVPVGPHKETAAVIQDLFYKQRGDQEIRRIRQIPIANNITRVKYEYLHEVPVYYSRLNGNTLEIAYQNMDDGTVGWYPETDVMTTDIDTANAVPLISHWELRIIDVAIDSDFVDPGVSENTGAIYAGTHWEIADQYPEGLNDDKRTGTHLAGPNGRVTSGLGTGGTGWNTGDYYNTSTGGDDSPADNAPLDRFAFLTVDANGLEGGMGMIRPDMGALHGQAYQQYSESPTGLGDMGDADGIPDGDGVADDPVPGWWLPYMRAVRVTIVATPKRIIEERMTSSGSEGATGTPVYYRLDSPVPYADANRITPLFHQASDFIGEGEDIVLTKTIPVEFIYGLELAADPRQGGVFNVRRVEYNYFRGSRMVFEDPISPDSKFVARTPYTKYWDKTTENE